MRQIQRWIIGVVAMILLATGPVCGTVDVVEDHTWNCMEQTYDPHGNPYGWRASQEWECQNEQEKTVHKARSGREDARVASLPFFFHRRNVMNTHMTRPNGKPMTRVEARQARQLQIRTAQAHCRTAAQEAVIAAGMHPLTPYGAYERIVRSGIILPSSGRRVHLKKAAFHRVLQACSREEIRTMARALKRDQQQDAAKMLAQYVEAYAATG